MAPPYTAFVYGDPAIVQAYIAMGINAIIQPSGLAIITGSSGNLGIAVQPVAQVLQGGTIGISYSETITAVGGTGSYTFSLNSGSLPTGLSLSSGGIISGTPSAIGTYIFFIRATDTLLSSGVQEFQITIADKPPSGNSAYSN